MIYRTLAFRHLLVRPGRALVLLLGYGLGVAVMIVLLSVGDAMLDQARDTSLVGGGDLTALPEGVDLEALRTGGLTGMFWGINGARFVARTMLGGPREAAMVSAVSPLLEQKLLLVHTRDSVWAVRAGGEIPSESARAGTALHLLSGSWHDERSDSLWRRPTLQALYDELDHFHTPAHDDRSWGEWHYFNVVVSEKEWWYITLLVGGDVAAGSGRGEVLLTHRLPDGTYQRFSDSVGAAAVVMDTTRADLVVGKSSVTQRDGSYHVAGGVGPNTFDLTIRPAPLHYFPPVELGRDQEASGYVVPGLVASATGTICIGRRCDTITNAAAYHDHNWGSWRAVTWEWGAGHGDTHSLVYGGVIPEGRERAAIPYFFALEDSLGVQQVYRFDAVQRIGSRPVPGIANVMAPDSLRIVASRLSDTLDVTIAITDVTGSRSAAVGADRIFLQMRGRWRAAGRAAGRVVSASGTGFFETWSTVH